METVELRPDETAEKLSLCVPEAAVLVYKQMAAYMEEIGYTQIFDIRPFPVEDSLPDVLKLDRPHLPGKKFDRAIFDHIGTLLEELIIHREDMENIIACLGQLLEEWLPRLDNGENLVLLTNHMSYADILVLQYCLAAAKLRIRGSVSTDKHHAIVGRVVGLMEKAGLKPNGTTGHIMEDVLLPLGGVFQTVPPDQCDEGLPISLRNEIGRAFLNSYETVLESGGNIILLAGSGIEDDINGKRVMIHRIQSSTTALLRKPNRDRDRSKERGETNPKGYLTTMAIFLDLQPIRNGILRGPVHAKIGIGPPVVARKQSDIKIISDGLINTGNIEKLSTTPEIIYETKEDASARRVRTVSSAAIKLSSES